MNWDTFFDTGESVTADEARQFIASSEPGRYQLVDVRQTREYEKSHIPGSILIPLAELATRHTELDRNKPVIVYCQTGDLSRVACQILIQADILYVFNMTGGITQWQGEHSTGDEEIGLRYFVEGDYDSTFLLALQMEAGLKQLYQALAERSDNKEESFMLTQMAHFEDGHMAKLFTKQKESGGGGGPANDDLNIIEGGLDIDEMLTTFGSQLGTPIKVIQLAMKLEAQAFDLYCRLARKGEAPGSSAFYLEMAREEQQHLSKLAAELDALLDRE